MLSALKLFFGTKKGKFLLALLAVAGILIAAYSLGRSRGYTDGRTAGYNSRNEEVKELGSKVTSLTGLVNSKREAEAKKVDKIEDDAANQAVETQKQLALEIRKRDLIISGYKSQTPPAVQQECGLSVETVRAINQLIDTANHETNQSSGYRVGAADTPAATAGKQTERADQ